MQKFRIDPFRFSLLGLIVQFRGFCYDIAAHHFPSCSISLEPLEM